MNPFEQGQRWILLGLLGLLACLLGGVYLAWPMLDKRGGREVAISGAAASLRPMAPPTAHKPPMEAPLTLTEADAKFVRELREKFAGVIHIKHAQIKLIEQVMAYLQRLYPDDWQDRVYAYLRTLFPDLAGALYEKFQQLVRFNDWLRDNRNTLMQMPAASRRQALWDARREAFGEDAEQIFAGVVRNERLQDALAGLESAENLRFDEKLSVFMDAVHEIHGANAGHFIQNRQTELMNRFVEVPTVQADLRAMPAEERSMALRQMRSAMGLDEAALSRWDQLDRQRDQSWDSGQRYLAERRRIESEYEGEARDEQMQALRQREFGEEADIIRNEEEAGFYRYDRERRYGRE